MTKYIVYIDTKSASNAGHNYVLCMNDGVLELVRESMSFNWAWHMINTKAEAQFLGESLIEVVKKEHTSSEVTIRIEEIGP